jgi:haloalkane dehalogenase
MLDASDWRTLYPFAPHYLPLADGVRMHYVDEGSGEPLLMVHGNPTWSFYWRRLILAFRGRARCVAPDHVGCGLSDKPDVYPYTLARRRDDLVRLIDELDLRGITLLVHDWGGAIGLGAALAAPERFSRLVLFNTGAFPPPFFPLRIRVCRTPVLGRVALQGFNAFARAALSMATEKPERLSPAIRAGLLAPYDTWSHRRAVYEFVSDIPASPRHPTWKVLEEIEAGLPQLAHLPVMLIWGMRDWCFRPACLDRFIKAFPHAAAHRLEDCGHYVVEDGHERIVPLLEQFLARSAVRNASPADARRP